MKIDADGQVTIPRELREALGLVPDTEVHFEVDGETLLMRRADAGPEPERREPGAPYPGKGAELVARLWGKATTEMTTDEIMHLTRGED